jgi:D-threo-aldose 1-dehydrogenase
MLVVERCAERYADTEPGVNYHSPMIDPLRRETVGRGGTSVTRLGFGCAPIGGLYRAVTEDEAVATARHAWELGIRYFDVAPLYGYGNAERRLGLALAGRPREEFAVSTKVGRRLDPREAVAPGADIDRQARAGREDAFYVDTPPVRPVFDYSYDGVLRQVEESLGRLGLDRIDILYIHDPDDHWEAAISGAYPALDRLRVEGAVGAIGAGMNQWQMLARFARETDMDVFLLAGRYTLLDQSALTELLPLCQQKGIGIALGGVMNSGILADPRPGATFDYAPADARLVARAQRLRDICTAQDVPLKAAAVRFAMAHPQVVSLIAGVRSREHLDEYPGLMRHPIPAALWDELRAEGLIAAEAPVPEDG